jgi:hypothetical protein
MERQRAADIARLHDAPAATALCQVQVIATTEAGTRAALMEVRRLSRRLNVGRAVLLVPWTVLSTASVEGPANDAAVVDGYRQMADETGVDVAVRLCVCGGYSEAFRWMLPGGSMVVVGGRRRWWWPTCEQRIADRLKNAGHTVVFAEAR